MSDFDEWNKAIKNLPQNVLDYNKKLAEKVSSMTELELYRELNIRSVWLIRLGECRGING